MQVFIVNGKGRSGKDTFVQEVEKYVLKNYLPFEIYKMSTIDCIKKIARSFGWNGEKEPKDRKMLSDLKDLLTEWNDYSFKDISCRIKQYGQIPNSAIFVDCREPKEIDRLVKEFNAKSILVRRDNIDGLEYGNHADDDVFNYNYDIEINNSGTLEDLASLAEQFCKEFFKDVII
jgi:hypothetical protein